MSNKILIVDDEKNTREGIARFLRSKEMDCYLAENGKDALELLNATSIDLIVTDLRMPAMGGMDLISAVTDRYPDINMIVLTAYGSVESAVEAVKRGADDFLTKPINLDKLYITISKLLKNKQLEQENHNLRQQLDTKYGLENIIGNSQPMQRIYDLVKQVAPSRATVLIQGESGTGKELIAHAIHQLSNRRTHAFVPVHCAALSGTLLESELFGHEKGAFTGAIEQRAGRFEQAHNGTLFLDEISEVSTEVQVKLLRVIQEQSFERVGGTRTIHADIRFVAATNKNLEEEVRNNNFREDLFYRLNVVTVTVPPLRERQDDIPLILKYYLDKFARENEKQPFSIDPKAVHLLQQYSWPGNVRELRNCMENLVVLSKNTLISPSDLPEKILSYQQNSHIDNSRPPVSSIPAAPMNVKDNERSLIIKALKETNGNRTEAARALGMSRRTLYRKLERYGIDL